MVPPQSPQPRWLTTIRSAVLVDDAFSDGRATCIGNDVADVGDNGSGGGGVACPRGLTRAKCVFSSPLAPKGPRVVVSDALVDTGSSDCELHPTLMQALMPLPIVARGAVYETSIGGGEFDAYEILLTVGGRTCAAVVTCCEFDSSDNALVGHMALGALRLLVDCLPRQLIPCCDTGAADVCTERISGMHLQPTTIHPERWAARNSALTLAGPLHCANLMASPMERLLEKASSWNEGLERSGDAERLPVFLRESGTAIVVKGLIHAREVYCDNEEPACFANGESVLGRQIIPVTYLRCVFASPLAPDGPHVVVAQALVDTGSADCDLREGFLSQLMPVPVVARGRAYETVLGRVLHDTFEVLVTVAGRTCLAVATVSPEARFGEFADDPNSDEAVLGFAALMALGLVVDCSTRRATPRQE
eukprot:TRINITY_DN37627_c0_g1_i1.p1 TRINITY_DN37627_c0_g1~~TRINITY_DN37627_c0_g1_i1.p1  ORF type:complete len:445 (+),score=50.36 TRINITY_DN37627_c0_g1_i1:78-1337(+)